MRASHDSAAGRVEAGWTFADGAVDYRVVVPEGAEGLLILGPEHGDPTVDGEPVAPDAEGRVRRHLAPGAHRIAFRLAGAAAPAGGQL